MVVVDGMAEFVDDHVIAQVFGQGHQKKAQRNGITPRTTPPLGTRSPNRELGVFQPRQLRQPLDTRRKIGFGGPAQLFDAGFGLGGRKRGFRTRACSTQSAFRSRNCMALRTETPYGKETRTAPVPRTLIEMRRARRVRERVTSPSRGCVTVEIIASALR